MLLSLNDLRDITTICEMGSFRQAAIILELTQPTLSRRVELMEHRLNAQLFERSRGRSRPTALALLISEQAAGMLDAASNLVSEVERVVAGTGGIVRLGLGPAPMFCLFNKIVQRINREIPGVTLICMTGDTAMLMDHLERREIDAALCVHDPLMVRPDFESEEMIRSWIEIYSAPGHPITGRPPASFDELFSYTVAMPILEPGYKSLAKDRFGIDMSGIDGIVYCSNFHALMDLARSGSHAVLSPEFVFRRAVQKGVLAATALPARIDHEICLFTNPKAMPFPAVDKVLNILRSDIQLLLESD